MPLGAFYAALVAIGVAVAFGAGLVLRRSGASPGRARRLAGPAEVKVGRLLDADPLPTRPVRVTGRIRCRDPLVAPDGERLVCFHRDVEVRIGGRWRSVERLRESRSFDLWDHDGSLAVDPARVAEPLISIPQVWRGEPAELEEPHASAVAALAARHGPATEARAITRSLDVTDRLLVVARAVTDASGTVQLEPPEGGYLISNLELPDAMRLLGGRHRRAAAGAVIAMGMAIALIAVGGIGALLSAVLS
jgi:hypothetical protein